jgi:hypothetical protein
MSKNMLLILVEFRVCWKYYYAAHTDRFCIFAFQAKKVTDIMISFPWNSTDRCHTEYHRHTTELFAHSHRYQAMQLFNLKVQSLHAAQDKLTKLRAKKFPWLHEPRNLVTYSQKNTTFGLHPSRIHFKLRAPSFSNVHFNNIPAPWTKYPNSGLH